MKLPRRSVMNLSFATVLSASAALGSATPTTMAGTVNPLNPQVIFNTTSGVADTRFVVRPNPSVVAEVKFNPALLDPSVPRAGHQSIAGIQAEYGFIVHGPQAADLNMSVKLFYDFVNMVSGQEPNSLNTFYDAFLSVTLNHNHIPLLQLNVNQFATGPGNVVADSDIVGIDAVTPNVVYTVTLFADMSIFDRLGNPKESGFAEIDPVITFAPGFDSTGFSLEFAPGVGNEPDTASAVPEPSSLIVSSILLATFGTFGVARSYRRRYRTQAAA